MTANNPQTETQINTGRRRFIRTVAGGVVMAASTSSIHGCTTMSGTPSSAIAAWRNLPTDGDVIRMALSHAILAPNPHNLQPWLVDLSTPNEMLVAIDPTRLLPETDPYGRQIMIGTGAMLALFQLAAATRGYTSRIEWIGANAGESQLTTGKPILRVQVISQEQFGNETRDRELFNQIPNRHTVRANYDVTRMPAAQFAASFESLTGDGQRAGVVSRSTNSEDFNHIATRVKEGWRIELATPHTAMESVRLLRIGRREIEHHRDGITIDSPMVVLLDKLGQINRDKPLEPNSRTFNQQINQFNDSVDSTPAWFHLSSRSNTRMDQINVGKSYVFAQLKATALGLVMHPVSQGLQEYKEMQALQNQLSSKINTINETEGNTLQMLARVGYLPSGADKPKPSPRRGVDAHIV